MMNSLCHLHLISEPNSNLPCRPANSKVHRGLDDHACSPALRMRGSARPTQRHGAPAARVPIRRRSGDASPLHAFLNGLPRERCRAERSQTALSLDMHRAGESKGKGAQRADRLRQALQSSTLETGIVGHVGEDLVTGLCPDKDEQGAEGFTRRIDALIAIGAVGPFGTLGPLMRPLAAAIARTSSGPIMSKQSRLGKGVAPFTFYNFGSMVTDVEEGIHRELVASLINGGDAEGTGEEPNEAPYMVPSDRRVTGIGRVIPKTGGDGLSRFFNLLKEASMDLRQLQLGPGPNRKTAA